jgi:hypothetical protein
MTEAQQTSFRALVRKLEPTEFHHGDCVGADEDANIIVMAEFLQEVAFHFHPCTLENKRAHCEELGIYPNLTIHPVKLPLERNDDIVRTCSILIITPNEPEEIQRSGTWATYRYAKKYKKKIYVIKPDGSIHEE